MNSLTKFYCQLLQSMDCQIAEDGTVLMKSGEKEMRPVVVNHEGKEKTLVVPFKSVLKDSNWDKVIAFHPACENVFDGQSEVLNTLINLANLKLYRSVQTAVTQMLTLAGNTNEHSKLRRQQLELVSNIGECSASTMKYIYQVINKGTGISGKSPTLTLKLYRDRKIGDVKYDRICKLLTPILDEADPIYGLTASTKSQKAVKAAYRMAFPEQREVGTNSKDCPYLSTVLTMFVVVCRHLNELKEIMGKHGKEMHMIDVSWFEQLADLRKMYDANIKYSLPGNTGAGMAKEKDVRATMNNGSNTTRTNVAAPAKPSVPKNGDIVQFDRNGNIIGTAQTIPTPKMPKAITPIGAPVSNIPAPPVNVAAPAVIQPPVMVGYNNNQVPPAPAPVAANAAPVNSVVARMKQAEMAATMGAYGMMPGQMPGMMPGMMPMANGYPQMMPAAMPPMGGYPQMMPNPVGVQQPYGMVPMGYQPAIAPGANGGSRPITRQDMLNGNRVMSNFR